MMNRPPRRGLMTATALCYCVVVLMLVSSSCSGSTTATPDTGSIKVHPTPSGSPASADHRTTMSPPVDPPPIPISDSTTSLPAGKMPAGDGRSNAPLVGLVVVLDPGHNGRNGSHSREINRLVNAGGFQKACNTTGTADSGYAESRFNFETAQRVRTVLSALGATVVMTRENDEGWGPCIDQRGLTTETAGADVLVSIHADGAGVGAHGFHVIYPGSIPGYTAMTAPRASVLAIALRDAMVARGFEPATYVGSKGLIARSDLGTLNRSGVPAVMIECGNMHNRADLAKLRSPDGQDAIASAIASALVSTRSTLTGLPPASAAVR